MAVFKNSYLIMRHGQSKANVAGIVVSDPDIGCERYGLTAEGRNQAEETALNYKGPAIDIILCSDFKRARETAEVVATVLSLPQPVIDVRLRERFFGEWEGQSSTAYEKVWERDAEDSSHTFGGVESTTGVKARTVDLIEALEREHQDKVILLVSHGDTLQIMTSVFHGIEPGKHRTLPHHETAEMKPLVSKGTDKQY